MGSKYLDLANLSSEIDIIDEEELYIDKSKNVQLSENDYARVNSITSAIKLNEVRNLKWNKSGKPCPNTKIIKFKKLKKRRIIGSMRSNQLRDQSHLMRLSSNYQNLIPNIA